MIIATVTSTAGDLRVVAKRASRSCRLIGNRKHGPWPAIGTRPGINKAPPRFGVAHPGRGHDTCCSHTKLPK